MIEIKSIANADESHTYGSQETLRDNWKQFVDCANAMSDGWSWKKGQGPHIIRTELKDYYA